MSMAALSSVNLRKTASSSTQKKTPAGGAAPAPGMGMMGLGPGFNPAAVKLKKTGAAAAGGGGDQQATKGREGDDDNNEQKDRPRVDFRANLRKTGGVQGQAVGMPGMSGGQVVDFRAGLRKTNSSVRSEGEKKEKKSEDGKFDFRANLRKTNPGNTTNENK